MYLSGLTLNIISLGGLARSTIRLSFWIEEGDDIKTATLRGVSDIASTLTTIIFVEGVAGQVFGNMALTVVFSLSASLLVALYFIPMLASRKFGDTRSQASLSVFNWKFLGNPWARYSNDRREYGLALFLLTLSCIQNFYSHNRMDSGNSREAFSIGPEPGSPLSSLDWRCLGQAVSERDRSMKSGQSKANSDCAGNRLQLVRLQEASLFPIAKAIPAGTPIDLVV